MLVPWRVMICNDDSCALSMRLQMKCWNLGLQYAGVAETLAGLGQEA